MPLIDIDPLSGAVELTQYDQNTKALITTRTENVDALLDANQASYNGPRSNWEGEEGDFWHVASIPLTLLWAWMQDFNAPRGPADQLWSPFARNEEWERFMYGRLNGNDFRKLKTAPVHV